MLELTAPESIRGDAQFGQDKLYRYWLLRVWNETLPSLRFVLLNPSIATEMVDDPTMRRCVNYAKGWGFGGMRVLNIFALRSTDPRALYHNAAAGVDPIGADNDDWLRLSVGGLVVCGWGDGQARNRSEREMIRARGDAVRSQLEATGCALRCFGRTECGNPKHPLYLRGDAELEVYAG